MPKISSLIKNLNMIHMHPIQIEFIAFSNIITNTTIRLINSLSVVVLARFPGGAFYFTTEPRPL